MKTEKERKIFNINREKEKYGQKGKESEIGKEKN